MINRILRTIATERCCVKLLAISTTDTPVNREKIADPIASAASKTVCDKMNTRSFLISLSLENKKMNKKSTQWCAIVFHGYGKGKPGIKEDNSGIKTTAAQNKRSLIKYSRKNRAGFSRDFRLIVKKVLKVKFSNMGKIETRNSTFYTPK